MANYVCCENIDQLLPISSSDLSGHDEQIRIWKIDIESQLHRMAGLESILTAEEKVIGARFHQKKDAQQFIITRAILRILLAEVIPCRPEEVKISNNTYNKPLLSDDKGVYFNISHSHHQAVVAIAKQEIGIDLEYIQPNFDYRSVAEFAFSDQESDSLSRYKNPLKEFFRLWTRKEAFLKGLGTGLINDLKLISCLDAKNVIPAQISGIKADWMIKTSELGMHYLMSIAYEQLSPGARIVLLNLDDGRRLL